LCASILTQVENHIAVITINRPEHLNVLTMEVAREINQTLLEMDEDNKIRVIVIRGAGNAFCAGIDVSEFLGKSSVEYRGWVSSLMNYLILVIGRMKKPVIASVQGYAIAYGAGLVAACDLAVASEDALFGVNAINVGLFCMGPAVPLSRSIGRKRCLQMLMTGELIDASTACAWGLVNQAVPRPMLEEATMKLARTLAAKSPMALQMGKQAFYGMSDLEFEKAVEYSNQVFAALCTTEDARQGVEAFLNKSAPVWKCR
jgi:enoyl-CoA hydratase/carnithine racemase